LYRAEVSDGKRAGILCFTRGCRCGRCTICQFDLGIKSPGKHPLVLVDQFCRDICIVDEKRGNGGKECIGSGIKAGSEQINDFYHVLFPCPCFKKFVLTGTDDLLLQLALDNLKSLLDLLLISSCAIFSDEKFRNIRWNRVVAPEFLREIFSYDIAFKSFCYRCVKPVKIHHTSITADPDFPL